MKKILSTLCGLGCLSAIIVGFAENPDGSCNFGWTIGFLSLATFLGWANGKLDKEDRSNG